MQSQRTIKAETKTEFGYGERFSDANALGYSIRFDKNVLLLRFGIVRIEIDIAVFL